MIDSKKCLAILVSEMLVTIWVPSPASGEFVRGHIYVSIVEAEPCDFGGTEAIVDINPQTGEFEVLADSSDPICVGNGLRFTPDGERLLAASEGHFVPQSDGGWITAFGPDGDSEVILDASDGLNRPFGTNCLAFDREGDLYVLNSGFPSRILRFPQGQLPGTVYADQGDSVSGQGALEFALNGDLFYRGGGGGGGIYRITPDGRSSLFDELLAVRSLAHDRMGNLYAANNFGNIYRYAGGDPNARTLLASGLKTSGWIAMTVTSDGETVYVYEQGFPATLLAIDVSTGVIEAVTEVAIPGMLFTAATGMTIYDPLVAKVPTTSGWGMFVMALLLFFAVAALTIRGRAMTIAPQVG